MTGEQLRARILTHAKTRQTKYGPEYVGCKCARCRTDRAAMVEYRLAKLYAKP